MGNSGSRPPPPRAPPVPRVYFTPESLGAVLQGGWYGPDLGGAPAVPAPLLPAVTAAQEVLLVPGSLGLVVLDPARPTRLGVECVCDATSPFEVRVVVAGAHAERTNVLGSKLPPSAVAHVFPAGNAQRFSQADAARGAAAWRVEGAGGGEWRDCVDTSLYTPAELTHAPRAPGSGGAARSGEQGIPPNMYPVIVVMRAVDPATRQPRTHERAFEHSVYCTLVPVPGAPRDGDAATPAGAPSRVWALRPLARQVQLGERRYVVMDFFGGGGGGAEGGAGSAGGSSAESGGAGSGVGSAAPTATIAAPRGAALAAPAASSSAAAASAEAAALRGSECVICLSDPRSTAVLPCRHLCLCTDCAAQLAQQSQRCPICRGPVTSLLVVCAPEG